MRLESGKLWLRTPYRCGPLFKALTKNPERHERLMAVDIAYGDKSQLLRLLNGLEEARKAPEEMTNADYRANILHRRSDRAMPECLSDQGEIYISRHKVRGQGMFEDVRVPFLCWQANRLGAGAKDSEKLRSINPAAFL